MKYSESCKPLHQEIDDYSDDKIIQINERLYYIVEENRNIRFLILGDERAALIDTGYGYKNPWKQIREVTDLPLMVICTHGDPDHSLGVRWYSKAYIHQLDLNRILENDQDIEMKTRNINHYHKNNESLKRVKDLFLSNEIMKEQFICLQDKDVIDLGDRELEIIHVPAHTHGCIAILDKKGRDLFIGDNASYDDLWMFCLEERVPSFAKIKQSYIRLKEYEGFYDRIWGAHGKQPLHKGIIDEIIETIDDIYVNHDCEEINYSRFIASIVKGSTTYNHYYKNVKLVYTKEQLIELLRNGLDVH